MTFGKDLLVHIHAKITKQTYLCTAFGHDHETPAKKCCVYQLRVQNKISSAKTSLAYMTFMHANYTSHVFVQIIAKLSLKEISQTF